MNVAKKKKKMGIRKTEEKLVRWNVRVEMLSVADCIPQFLCKKND